MHKNKKGSGLIFAVILLFVILAMVVTLSSITVLETKMSQKSKSSVGAFYNSQSGVEWALNKISTTGGPNIITAFPSFSAINKKVPCPAGYGCDIYFLDDQGNVISDGNTAISLVKAVRSVGTQNIGGAPDTQRAIEAAVAQSACSWCTTQNIKVTSATHDGNFGGYQAMYNWIQTNGCAGYHVCSSYEITSYCQLHGNAGSYGWINTGTQADGYGSESSVTDCGGWQSNNSSNPRGVAWLSSGSGEQAGNSYCSDLKAVLCCKY